MPEMRASYAIGRADRVMRDHLEASLTATGLTLFELTVLSVLAARPGLSNARLARRSLVTPQATHKVMRSLENKGLITRAESDAGGRALETTVTEEGAQVLTEALPLLEAAEDAFFEPLDAEERATFEQLLRRVSRAEG